MRRTGNHLSLSLHQSINGESVYRWRLNNTTINFWPSSHAVVAELLNINEHFDRALPATWCAVLLFVKQFIFPVFFRYC